MLTGKMSSSGRITESQFKRYTFKIFKVEGARIKKYEYAVSNTKSKTLFSSFKTVANNLVLIKLCLVLEKSS